MAGLQKNILDQLPIFFYDPLVYIQKGRGKAIKNTKGVDNGSPRVAGYCPLGYNTENTNCNVEHEM